MDRWNVLVVDNEDSFTYNLIQLLEELDVSIHCISGKNTQWINGDAFDGVLFSPGPGLPSDFPCMEFILRHCPQVNVLGVCLGLQAIAEHFGATLIRMDKVQHGQVKNVWLNGNKSTLFEGVSDPFEVGLYHSWAVQLETLPTALEITCMSDDQVIMGLMHRNRPVQGLQFHPESFLTSSGKMILSNWLKTLKV